MTDVDQLAEGSVRTCVGCPTQLDFAAQLAGEREQPGWRQTCVGVICPDCYGTGHWPGYLQIAGTTAAYAKCGCGWEGEIACGRLAEIEAAWLAHNQSVKGLT